MSYVDECIKKDIKLNKDLYYHAFLEENMISIMKSGIICSFLQKKKSNGGYNGSYYISVCKKIEQEDNLAYFMFNRMGYNMFMLDSRVHAIKTDYHNHFNNIFIDTIIPFRTSIYKDEYHVFYRVNKDYIKGIRLSSNYLKNDLIRLKELIMIMKNNHIELPIYDYTYEDDNVIREVDKDKILRLKKELDD